MNGAEGGVERAALAEKLSLQLLDVLRRSDADGVCDFCSGTKRQNRSIFKRRLSGREVTICSKCSSFLTRLAFGRDRADYFSEWLRYEHQIFNTGDYGDVPPLVLAEWLSKRMIKRLSRKDERPRTEIAA